MGNGMLLWKWWLRQEIQKLGHCQLTTDIDFVAALR
ncbi:hypothetical protein SLEP1_g40340 [Rubroshorea leprosula]|uniref:Uncharacterized protein n=1 Tax=Rubroshorea leprosula TaxID=152421 RepID=A0AAV5L3G1_9ROSI|nr:hypothetical protein SLEP1_g40340 [Rubroshorea leprosula]